MKGALPPGLLMAGTASGAGKTVAALGLIRALRRLGLEVAAAKTGPDFIDTAFLAQASGGAAANLDVWMCRAGAKARRRGVPAGLARLRRRLLSPVAGSKPDVWVVEGAMGLYDGGPDGAGGAAQLAKALDLPVLLVLNVRGMGQSVAALAEGFLRHKLRGGRPRFLGLICTQSGGAAHEKLLHEALAPVLAREKLPLFGFLPRAGAPKLASRHLGLVEAREALEGRDLDGIGRWFAGHCDVAAILRALDVPQPQPAAAPTSSPRDSGSTAFFPFRRRAGRTIGRPRIGIARDAAFSFCYADLPALLAGLGAEPVFFSPLADAAPPEGCAGLYFPGGYPELHAEALAANTAMVAALREFAGRGLPVYGECGGYIYLMREVQVGGARHALAGLLPLTCHLGDRLAALGYREAEPLPGWLPARPESEKSPLVVRGHEFHYARLNHAELPPDCVPLWRVSDAAGEPRGLEGCRLGRVAGSWLHLYPEGSRRFWKAWLELTRAAERPDTKPQPPELPCP
ncbi:MAG: cobyrinate a,c-diamide synthase [Desulfovibrio sp.]|uniref:cobyrinate a,c-diamide synthase n=1 Tax=Desulfovibrio sp. TaxID=885 RepID=UPI001A6D5889|nr:cobyrinate a,c-diamide synthase [Desulfovibrio sp.]MBD5418054.1 cobyrinate a,c-diamide synthase [Desulfovibrio sp.]